MRAARALYATCVLLLSLACGRERDKAQSAPSPATAPAERKAKSGPARSAAARRAVEPAEVPHDAPVVSRAPAPPHSCVLRAEHDLGVGARVVVGVVGTQALAVVASERELALLSLSQTGFAKRDSVPLAAAALRATLVCGARCDLALVDDKARLLAYELEGERLRELGVVATGVDRRFAPALLRRGARVAYAYTRTVDEAMHTLIASGGAGQPSRDVTPLGHGAAAATVLLGAKSPALVTIDARAGLSPLLEIPLDDTLEPRPAIVRTPVSQPFAPPALAALTWPSGEAEVFYTLVGRLAMTAIGRIPLRTAREPTPLSPSRGYGELSLAVVFDEGVALFAVEVPSAPEPAAKRTLTLKVASERATHDALTVAKEKEAWRPSLAVRGRGEYLLGYTSGGRVHVAELGCTP